jgi:NADH-quinone oxidoreductase subunit E
MIELVESDLQPSEVGIFLFEIGDFSPIQKSADIIKERGHELMNSLKFNEVDWTIVVKKKAD